MNIFKNKFIKINTNGVDYICPVLFLFSTNVIKQKHSKKQSVYKSDFVDTILCLSNTKIYICYKMLEKVKKLVDLEYQQLLAIEEKMLKEFNLNVINYNKYKLENNIKINELWLSSTFDILLDGLKSLIINDSIQRKNLKIMENIKVDILSSSTVNVSKNLNSVKSGIVNIDDKLQKELNKKKMVIQSAISKVQKHLSKIALINFWYKYYSYIYDNKLVYMYYTSYSDFRGRIYYKSAASIQDNWMFRYIFHLGYLDLAEYKKINMQLPSFFSQEIYNTMKGAGIHDIKLFYVIFSLGILFKKTIKLTEGFIGMPDIFYKGISIYKKHINKTLYIENIENKVYAEILYLTNIIDCVSVGDIKKWYIIKDTTASVNQHSGKILGFKQNSLKYVNLDNDLFLYDTYNLYVNYFKEIFKIKCPSLVIYINRDLLKQIIMTVSYGAGRQSTFKLFADHISGSILDKNIRLDFLKNFNTIYNVISKQIIETKYLYKKNRNDFKAKIVDLKYFAVEDLEVYIDYYIVKTYVIVYKINGVRKSITIPYTDFNSLDISKIEKSTFVNLIHQLDAAYLRRLIRIMNNLDINIITIHDAFIVSFYNVGFLILYANEVFNINQDCGIFININDKIQINSNSILV